MTIPIYFYINLIALLLWFVLRKRFIDSNLKKVGLYLLVMFLAEVGAWVYSKLLHTGNHWIYNLIIPFQVMYLVYIYHSIVSLPAYRRMLKAGTVLFLMVYILNILFIQGMMKFNTYSYIWGCLLVIYCCVGYFKHLLDKKEISPLHRIPFFWISVGNIVFFSGSLFYMGSINYILEKKIDRAGELISFLVYSFTAIQYFLFCIAFLCNLKPSRKYSL